MNFIKKTWRWLRSPAGKYSIGGLFGVGFIAGIIFWGGFNTSMAVMNTEEFCISCHEMEENVYHEYQSTIHYTNRSGVRATCPDCHVPKSWGPKMIRKMKASKELYHKMLGTINTPEKFEEHRAQMAQNEWKRMKANDSQECRNCHHFEYMDLSVQADRPAFNHQKAMADGDKTCIDCHKGIAHSLPDMSKVAPEYQSSHLFEDKDDKQ